MQPPIWRLAPISAMLPLVHAIGPLDEAKRSSLLDGPTEDCTNSSNIETCIIDWATKLKDEGLVPEFEKIHAESLPPQLTAHFEVDANSNLTYDEQTAAEILAIENDDLIGSTQSALKEVCCLACNPKKTKKICDLMGFIPILTPVCIKEMHKCCTRVMHKRSCQCVCRGRDGCTDFHKHHFTGGMDCKL